MPCHFSGVFYLSSIYNRSLTCHFISDDPDTSQTVNMTNYAPSITERDGPFHEPDPAQPQKVYFITGIMAIENSNYIAPLVNHLYIVTPNSRLVSSSSCLRVTILHRRLAKHKSEPSGRYYSKWPSSNYPHNDHSYRKSRHEACRHESN